MRSFYWVAAVASFVLLFLCVGCGSISGDGSASSAGDDSAADEAVCEAPSGLQREDAQLLRAPLYAQAELGGGVLLGDDRVVGTRCLESERTPVLNWVNLIRAQGSTVRCLEDVHREFLEPLAKRGWSHQSLEEIAAFFGDYYDEHPDAELVVTSHQIETVRRKYGTDFPEQYEGVCADSPDGGGAEWFVETCGDHYVDGETLGGLVIGFIDVAPAPHLVDGGLLSVLMGTAPGDECERCDEIDATDARVGVMTLGFDGPGSDEPGAFVDLSANKLSRYLGAIMPKAADARNAGELDSPAYGAPVRRSINHYRSSTIRHCLGAERDEYEGLGCYTWMTGENGRALELSRRFLNVVEHHLESENYDWSEAPDGAHAAYQDAADELSRCTDELEQSITRCKQALGDETPTCEACDRPEDCSHYDIEEVYDRLPSVH